MNQIQELREKRAKAWDAAKAFLDTKRGNDGLLSEEDVATYEKMETAVVNLGKEIDRLVRQNELDAELSKPTAEPLTTKPVMFSSEAKTGRTSDEYRKAFWNALRTKHPGAPILNALQVGTDSEGGYLVPDEYEKTLIKKLGEINVFRQIAHVINTGSGNHLIPVEDSKGSAYWVAEEGAVTESDSVFSQVTLSAYKLATLMKISDELLNDSVFDLASYAADVFARRIGDKEEEAFCVGDGNGKPTGVFHATAGASAGVTAASVSAIVADELISLYYAVKPAYRGKGVWLMNDATEAVIKKLKDSTGQYLWQQDLRTGDSNPILLGRPVLKSSFVPGIEAGAKTIAFGDFSYYWIADRQGRSFQRLNELYATTGQVGFLGTQRVDGKLVLSEAVKCLKMKA